MSPQYLCLLVALAGPVAAQTPELRLWAMSDGLRVNPVDGRVFEARTDIHQDYPKGDFRAPNSVWNEGTRTVALKAARNEFLAFQVIVEAERPTAGVDVKFAGLTGTTARASTASTPRCLKSGTCMCGGPPPVTNAVLSAQAGIPMP